MRTRAVSIVVAALIGVACQPAPPVGSTEAVAPAVSPAAVPPEQPVASPSVTAAASPAPLPTAAPVSVLVDTDGAPDDLVAIAFLVAAPNVELAAITVSGTGEVHCPHGAELVLGLLERLHAPQIPVACGQDRPISLDHAFPDAFRSNADAAAGLDLPPTARTPATTDAVDLITTTATAGGGDLRILTLGPLTNLAGALGKADLSDAIDAVFIMGGAVDVPGNIAGSPGGPQDNTTAEWNVYVDPAALASVLGLDLGVRLVSLDGTDQVPLTRDFAARVVDAADAPPLEVLAELLRENDYMASGTYYLWDAIAAVAAAGYPVADFTDAHLTVDVTDGVTSGTTRRAEGPSNAGYMTTADAETIERLLISVMNGA
jgi:inosine-uridine nucleoside N-ribohydrolase